MAKKFWMTCSLVLLVGGAVVGCSSQPEAKTSEGKAPEAKTTEAPAAPEADATKGSSRAVEDIKLAPGADPMVMVFATRQPNTEAVGSEQFRLNFTAPDKAVVIVTKTGLADDSVAATRTRYEFAASGTGAAKWQLTQVSEQNKCKPDRGSRDWTGDLCK
jgi:hypothetical protein